MGNYASIADLKSRFRDDAEVAHYTDDEATGIPDTGVLNELIDGAESELNAPISLRYAVPVVTTDAGVNATFKNKTLDVAVYNLVARGDAFSEAKRLARDDAIEWAEKIGSGKANIPSAATLAATTSNDPLSAQGTAGTGTSSARLFSTKTMGAL